MFTVHIEHECACFKKSEYTNNNTFNTQQEAYRYADILSELMNEEFCGKHMFHPHKAEGDNFIIKVAINTTAHEENRHISCDVGCGSTDKWTLESTKNSEDENCDSNCGCQN